MVCDYDTEQALRHDYIVQVRTVIMPKIPNTIGAMVDLQNALGNYAKARLPQEGQSYVPIEEATQALLKTFERFGRKNVAIALQAEVDALAKNTEQLIYPGTAESKGGFGR